MRDLIAVVHPYLLLAAGFSNIILILLALFSKSGDKTKYIFCYFALGIAGYLISYGLISLTQDDKICMTYSLIGQLFINQISPALYIFSVFSLHLRRQRIAAFLAPLIGLSIVFLLSTVDVHIIVHHWWGNFNYYGGDDMPLKLGIYFLFFFSFMALSFWNFIRAHQKETNILRRTQLRYLIVGLMIAYLASWDHFPTLGIDVYPFGYIPLTIFSGIMFYSISKHQFLDIKIALKRLSAILLIYSILLLISLPAALPLLKALLINTHYNPTHVVLGIGIIVGTIFSFGPFIYAFFLRNNYWLRGHITAGLTHELKSPLNAIQSAIDVMSEKVESATMDKEKAGDYIDMIRKNASRLEIYVQDLLNMAKIQEENICIDKSQFDFSILAGEVCDSYKSLAEKKKLILKTNIESNIQIEGDTSKLRQVVSNLLSNAIKFTESGEIQLEFQNKNGEVFCQVIDSGVGLDKKDLKKIFDRFFQARPNMKGSGIGLTIAKAWVEAHGGRIWAESDGEGKGTKVSFTLPMG